jgi:hypothetical protein
VLKSTIVLVMLYVPRKATRILPLLLESFLWSKAMYPQLSLIKGPVLNVETSSSETNSEQRLAQLNGLLMPVVPTQYVMSTSRESSSSSLNSWMEMWCGEGVGDAEVDKEGRGEEPVVVAETRENSVTIMVRGRILDN